MAGHSDEMDLGGPGERVVVVCEIGVASAQMTPTRLGRVAYTARGRRAG